MRVGFDARISRTWDTGVGRLTVQLLRELRKSHHADSFVLLKSPAAPSVDPAQTGYQEIVLTARTPSFRQLVLGLDLKRCHFDVVLHTHQLALPIWSGCPAIAVVLDVLPLLFPEHYSSAVQLYFRTVLPACLRNKAAVVTISQASRRDVIDRYGLPQDRVVAIPLATADVFRLTSDTTAVRSQLDALGLRCPYLLCVGNQRPHKNLPGLLVAYARLVGQHSDMPDLVLAGTTEDARSSSSTIAERVINELGLGDRVKVVGKVTDEQLSALYGGAEVTVVPSLYEGFGLTALEAMASGSPVVASNAGALPEVVGEAGVLVDPTNPAAIAEGILSVLNDSGERQRLRQAGLERAASFSWSESANALYSVLRSAVQ